MLELPKDADECWFVEEAAKRGVKIQGLMESCFDKSREALPPTLIVGYAVLKEEDIKPAIGVLYELYCMRNGN